MSGLGFSKAYEDLLELTCLRMLADKEVRVSLVLPYCVVVVVSNVLVDCVNSI